MKEEKAKKHKFDDENRKKKIGTKEKKNGPKWLEAVRNVSRWKMSINISCAMDWDVVWSDIHPVCIVCVSVWMIVTVKRPSIDLMKRICLEGFRMRFAFSLNHPIYDVSIRHLTTLSARNPLVITHQDGDGCRLFYFIF